MRSAVVLGLMCCALSTRPAADAAPAPPLPLAEAPASEAPAEPRPAPLALSAAPDAQPAGRGALVLAQAATPGAAPAPAAAPADATSAATSAGDAGPLFRPGPPLPAPALAGASNFGQGWHFDTLSNSMNIPVGDYRDGMNWALAETVKGAYDFSDNRLRYPENVAAAGGGLSVTLNWGNPLYDEGETPHSPEAVAAFGAFAAELVSRFPAIHTIEVGNEFNGARFVTGPVREAGPTERALYHLALLKSVATQVRAARPGVRVAGGAAHSIPVGYLGAMADAGAAEHMDALALHPYTTPPEQIVPQVEVLRRHPALARMPIEATEIGHPDPARAAGHLLKSYCRMALAGFSRVVWYPMNARDDGMVPLLDDAGIPSAAGRAYGLIRERLAGLPVRAADPDATSYGCLFGDEVLLLWGEPRPVTLRDPALEVLDPRGAPLEPEGLALSMEAPILVVAPEGVDLATAVALGPTGILADSYHHFAYPEAEEAQAEGDAFARFARRGGAEVPLVTLPGQEATGTPWFPYRGNRHLRPARVTAEALVPGGDAADPVEIVHRYVAPRDMGAALDLRLSTSERSEDGVTLSVTLNGAEVMAAAPARAQEVAGHPLRLAAGDLLEIAVGPGATARGDVAAYRITLREVP